MSNFCSRSLILLFHMCFGIRILSPFHLATQIVSIQNLHCPKNAKNVCADMIFIPAPCWTGEPWFCNQKAKLNANDIHAIDHFRFLKLNFSEKTFYENGRRWIRMLNKFHIHGREFCKYGRAHHMFGRSFQKTCLRMRFQRF